MSAAEKLEMKRLKEEPEVREEMKDLPPLESGSGGGLSSGSDPSGSSGSVPQQRSVDRTIYVDSLKLFLRTLPALLDHLSDIPILLLLWSLGYRKLFWVGLAIDLLPGPVAVYQFFLLGHKREAFLLFLHPINVFLWTFLAICRVSERVTAFAKKVVGYCHESQALLESPLQVIFNLSLICHGILPAPWDRTLVFRNAWGNEINLSFFPTLSILFSLFSILMNAGGTVNLVENLITNPKRSLTWMLFLLSNILFRLQAWVLLATYLDVYALPVLMLNFIFGLVTLICVQEQVKVDPVLSAVYSLVFPITFMKSVYEATVIESELAFIKRIQKILTLFGTATLLLALWLLYALLPVLEYNPEIIVARDAFLYFLLSCTALGLIGVSSTFFVSFPRPPIRVLRRVSMVPLETVGAIHKKYSLPEKHLRGVVWTAVHFTNWPLQDSPRARNGVSIGARAALIVLVVLAASAPYVLPRAWNKTTVDVTVCGEGLEEAVTMYHLGPRGANSSGVLRECKDVSTQEIDSLGKNFELLACLEFAHQSKMVLLDKAFSTRVPAILNDSAVLLVRNNSQQLPVLQKGVRRMAICASDPDLVVAARAGDVARMRELLARPDAEVDVAAVANGQTALSAAAEAGQAEAAVLLLQSGANVSASTSGTARTPMHFAAESGSVEIVELLAEAGADVDAADSVGETPVFLAAKKGDEDVVKILLNLGADWRRARADGVHPLSVALVKGRSAAVFGLLWREAEEDGQEAVAELVREDGGRLLLDAASGGILEAVRTLLQEGVDVEFEVDGGDGDRALLYAAKGDHAEVVEFLVSEGGADVNVAGSDRRFAPLHWAVEVLNHGMVRMLVGAGANVTAQCDFNKPYRSSDQGLRAFGVATPLLMASLYGRADMVSFLLEHGADPIWIDDLFQNGLHKATVYDSHDVFKILLDAGADVTQWDDRREGPVHNAGRYDAFNCIRVVVEAGHDLTQLLNGKQSTAMHDAAFHGATGVVRYLVEEVPDMGRRLALFTDNLRFVPLHLAATSGDAESIRLLTADGFSPVDPVADYLRTTPLLIAAEQRHVEALTALLDAGADINYSNEIGATALMMALFKARSEEDEETASVLLERGADVHQTDYKGRTAIFFATSNDMARLLVSKGANPSVRSNNGDSILHSAARRGRPGLARFALEFGFGREDRNAAAETPMELARAAALAAMDKLDARLPAYREVVRLLDPGK